MTELSTLGISARTVIVALCLDWIETIEEGIGAIV